jgi:type I restriction enzyme S subunit
MEVRPGYKQTEVGVIPEDWGVSPLEAFTQVVASGKSKHSKALGTYPVHGSTGVIGYTESPEYEGEAILVARVGANAGRINVVSGRYGVTDNTIILRLGDGASRAFIWRSLEAKRLNRMVFGSGQPLITGSQLKSIKISTPPLPEQHAIAEALSDVDALLGGLDRLIAKKRDLKQAAMQQLLTGQMRLPGFSGDWEPLNMAQKSLLKARIGWQGLTTAEYLATGTYYLVTGTDFSTGRVTWATCPFVAADRYEQDQNIQLRLKDVLVTKDGTIGKVAIVDELPGPATLNSGVFVIRPNGNAYQPMFLYFILASAVFEDFLRKLAAGSTISHLYQKDFVSFEFPAPPTVEEQAAIAAVLSDMDAELAALEARRDKIRDLKQAMMQELLTGKTRLVKPEAAHA